MSFQIEIADTKLLEKPPEHAEPEARNYVSLEDGLTVCYCWADLFIRQIIAVG